MDRKLLVHEKEASVDDVVDDILAELFREEESEKENSDTE